MAMLLAGLVVAACVAAVVGRNTLRAWWWCRGLAAETDAASQSEYTARLAGLLRDGSGGAAWCLASLLRDPRPDVRAAAAGVLAHGSSDVVVDALLTALSDAQAEVRDAAAAALAFGPGVRALAALQARIASAPRDEALAACVAIGRMNGDACDQALVDIAAHHADAHLRAQAAEFLGIRRVASAARVLERLAQDDSPVTIELYEERRGRLAGEFAAKSRGRGFSTSRRIASTIVADIARKALHRLAGSATRPAAAG